MNIIASGWHTFSGWAMGFGGLGFLIALCLFALWYFTPPFLSSIAARTVLFNVACAFAAFSLVSAYYYGTGYKACTTLIASENAGAIKRAADGVKEIEVCRDGGGHWDVTTGQCGATQ